MKRLENIARTVAGGSLLIALEGCSGSVAAPTDIKPINTPFPTATSVDNPIAELTRAAQAPRPIETPIPTAAIVFQPTPESSVIAFSSKAPTVIASTKPSLEAKPSIKASPKPDLQPEAGWTIYNSLINPLRTEIPLSWKTIDFVGMDLFTPKASNASFKPYIYISRALALPQTTSEDLKNQALRQYGQTSTALKTDFNGQEAWQIKARTQMPTNTVPFASNLLINGDGAKGQVVDLNMILFKWKTAISPGSPTTVETAWTIGLVQNPGTTDESAIFQKVASNILFI